MMPALIEFTGQGSGGSGLGVVIFIFALLVGLGLLLRRRGRPASLPLPDARRAFDEMERAGRRDPRTEGHIAAFMSWCRTYAVLTVISCGAIAFLPPKGPVDPDKPPPDRRKLALFGGIALAEAVGLVIGGRLLARGDYRGRWISCAALSAVSLSGAAAVTLRFLDWSEGDRFDVNLMAHGVLTFYALAGATFLLLPRSARLFTPEYQSGIPSTETPATRAALMVGRGKSPFTWIPILGIAAAFALTTYNDFRTRAILEHGAPPKGERRKFFTPRSLSSNATADNRYEPPAPRTETSGHERYRLPLLPSGPGGVHRS